MKKRILSMALAAALTFGASQQSMAQTPVQQGVRAGSNTTTVNETAVTTGQVVSAGRGTTVTVTTTDRTGESTPKVAKVTVTKITDIKATGITVTSADNVTTMNGNASLQMTANFDPTYTDDKTVLWSVESAPESSATANIDQNGLLTAGTVQGDVVVTAMTQDGSNLQATKTITITTIPLDETSTTINVAAATYNGGNPVTPAVTVKYGTTDLVEGQDYTLGSWTNNTNAGTASVTITGTGAYSGSIVKNFTINKANGWCTVSPNPTTGWGNTQDIHTTTFTITNHGGNLSVSFSNPWSTSVTPPLTSVEKTNGTPTGTITIQKTSESVSGNGYNMTFTSAATDNYNAASITIMTQP